VAKLNKRLKRTLPSVLLIIGGAPLSRALARMLSRLHRSSRGPIRMVKNGRCGELR
jgi:hypothetical protein